MSVTGIIALKKEANEARGRGLASLRCSVWNLLLCVGSKGMLSDDKGVLEDAIATITGLLGAEKQ